MVAHCSLQSMFGDSETFFSPEGVGGEVRTSDTRSRSSDGLVSDLEESGDGQKSCD